MKFDNLKVGMRVLLRYDLYNKRHNITIEHPNQYGTIFQIIEKTFIIEWDSGGIGSGFTEDHFYYLDFSIAEFQDDFNKLIGDKNV